VANLVATVVLFSLFQTWVFSPEPVSVRVLETSRGGAR
jgi:hypothetical protein